MNKLVLAINFLCFVIFSFAPIMGKADMATIATALVSGGVTAVATDTGLTIKNEMTEADYRRVAEGMFKVREALTHKYSLADDLTLGMYVLRYLSDLGSYEVENKDIMALVSGLEQLSGEPFDPEFKTLLAQIERIRFGERKGVKYVKIFTLNREGIRIPLDTLTAGSTGNNQVKFLMVKNKSQIFFSDLVGAKNDQWLKEFIRKKVRFFFFAIKSLNQINKSLSDNIVSYIKGGRPVPTLLIEFEGIYARVSTTTLFKDVDFYIKRAVAMPGISNGQEGLPSFALEARGKLLQAKVSIDR
ncbi:MAG: hypothetical protein A2X86_15365 [Bdellovibrionales bacterium GWA2_49_15]|nr:MAG: hypothetical protein A2X86_15365 [Bdellovibrionales bacterium GWA2_49_15]HAZ13141.1 hypothetical protein [Bdellovibrionales bacterium]